VAEPVAQQVYEVECPHCGKTFAGRLLTAGSSAGPRGFKCPHCRLFVPLERAHGHALGEPGD
jgi:transposase-like protein